MLRTTALLTIVAAALLAGCGGKSTSSKLKEAEAALRDPSVPGLPDNGPKPSSVVCRAVGDQPDCTVKYPDGQVQDCKVDISGNSRSISCNLTKATLDAANAARRFVGTWDTTFGQMQLKNRPGHVGQLIGVYASCNGRIDAVAAAGKLSGVWHESGTGDCSTSHGRFTWTLSPDGGQFEGTWDRSDGTTGGPWHGTKTSS